MWVDCDFKVTGEPNFETFLDLRVNNKKLLEKSFFEKLMDTKKVNRRIGIAKKNNEKFFFAFSPMLSILRQLHKLLSQDDVLDDSKCRA